MQFKDTGFAGLFLIELDLVRDERGYFARTFCADTFKEHGLQTDYPQNGTSFNAKSGTVRGMHFQKAPYAEIKLIRCTRGAIHDVVIDVRPGSATYLKHFGIELAEGDGRELYVPDGFAHGFQTLRDASEVHYMLSTRYVPEAASGFRWDDPAFALSWPRPITVISGRDRMWPLLDGRTSACWCPMSISCSNCTRSVQVQLRLPPILGRSRFAHGYSRLSLSGSRTHQQAGPSECCVPELIPHIERCTPLRNEVVTRSGRWSHGRAGRRSARCACADPGLWGSFPAAERCGDAVSEQRAQHVLQDPAVAVVVGLAGRVDPHARVELRRRRPCTARHVRAHPPSSAATAGDVEVSSPVRPSDSAVSPSGNCSGSTPIPTRLERWIRSKRLGDHGPHAEQRRALRRPVARRPGAVLLAGQDHQRHALGRVALGGVVDRRSARRRAGAG